MAIFGTKKNTEKKVAAPKAVKAAKASSTSSSIPAAMPKMMIDVILRPHITEKAGIQNESQNIYTFQVAGNSTKHTIAKAIYAQYKVVPTAVRIINLPMKSVFVRGKKGTQSGVKKALVSLKKGDKIEFA